MSVATGIHHDVGESQGDNLYLLKYFHLEMLLCTVMATDKSVKLF